MKQYKHIVSYEPSEATSGCLEVLCLSPYSEKFNSRSIPCTKEQLEEWLFSGKTIQAALGFLSVHDREFLMSGLLPEEWEAIFSEDE